MVSSCAAVGCKERAVKGSRLTFHRFPKNPDLRDKWIKALKRKNFEPTKNSRVCEKHFTDKSYNHFASRKILQENAVPEIFDFSGFVKHSKPKIQKLENPERIHCIQFVDVNGVNNNNLLPTQTRTIIFIDNVVKARRVEKSHSHVAVAGSSRLNGDITSLPIIESSFSLKASVPRESAVSVSHIKNVSTQSSFSPITSVLQDSTVPVPSFVKNILPRASSSLNTPLPQKPTISVRSVNNTLPQSSFSPSNSSSGYPKTPKSVVPRSPDVLTTDCTQKRLIGRAQQMKKKYKERLKVMNHVSRHLKKRKAFLENLLIRIKEKQLTSCEDVIDIMDCFIEEEDEEETLSSDEDSSNNAEEYENVISFIDGKISKFEKAVKLRSGLSNSSECEAFGMHLESVLNAMPKENATNVKNQITEVLKRYQGGRLLKAYRDFNRTFSGLENIEMNEIE